ncbi:MAG: isoprenylcysteine carboxylmethyltransferase family protein [Thermoanaerobaculia bacterium]
MRLGRPLPPVVLLLAIILLTVVHFLLPGRRILAYPANLVGLLPLAIGVYLNLAADRLLKRHHTTVKPFQELTALLAKGVYGHTRNPMYLGFVSFLLGIALLLGTAGPLVIVALFPVLIDLMYIRAEETMLRDRFGDEWVAYRARVRKWL